MAHGPTNHSVANYYAKKLKVAVDARQRAESDKYFKLLRKADPKHPGLAAYDVIRDEARWRMYFVDVEEYVSDKLYCMSPKITGPALAKLQTIKKDSPLYPEAAKLIAGLKRCLRKHPPE